MQERYLFRAKSCLGNWVYGFLKKQLVGGKADLWAIQTEGHIETAFGPKELYENVVDPATIGRCTGLKDENGTLIFEGDIVYIPDWQACFEVKWGRMWVSGELLS